MKGKAKEKRKIGKAILIGMGFFLTIILTFTTTLAWFYDSDWASKYINMAGTVGIEIRREKLDGEADDVNLRTSGTGNLYFHLYNEENNPKPLAYPGQAIDVSASAYNNGGKSGENGSACYIRAHFTVYTDIGKMPDEDDYVGGATSDAYKAAVQQYKIENNIADSVTPENSEDLADDLVAAGIKASEYAYDETKLSDATYEGNKAYLRDEAIAQAESGMNAEALYAFLYGLIAKQNTQKDTSGYYWHYYKHTGALPLSDSGTSTTDIKYYLDGNILTEAEATDATADEDAGYFYLCYGNTATNRTDLGLDDDDTVPNGILKPLGVRETAVFLWNDTFIIPWQLTNNSADKKLFVGVSFQAVQTFIPKMEGTTGKISADADNQLPATQCTYNSVAVQTVFSSCKFTPIDTSVLETIFGTDGKYDNVSTGAPDNDDIPTITPATPAT